MSRANTLQKWRKVMLATIALALAVLIATIVLVVAADVATRVGLWPIEARVDGKTIKMKGAWVPVSSRDKAIPPFSAVNGVMLVRVYGLLYGDADTLLVTPFRPRDANALQSRGTEREFPWGKAIILESEDSATRRVHLVSAQQQLMFTATRESTLEDIAAIEVR